MYKHFLKRVFDFTAEETFQIEDAIDKNVEALEKRNIELYRTDELGTILVISDGVNIKISNFKTDTNG